MSQSNGLVIECRPTDSSGKRKITAILGNLRYVDKFDPHDSFKRAKFRDAAISKFDLDEGAHEYIETKILAAADSESVEIFRPVVTMLDTVTATAVEWLWPNRLAVGKNNLLCGDAGLGKSLFTLDIAARVSRGAVFPDGSRSEHGPAGVVILTMEDDAADTMVPRLLAHNADTSRIALVEGLAEIDGDGKVIHGIDLAVDIQAVRSAVQQVENCKFVIVDTISDYIGGKTDTDKNRDVRSVLNPFAAMAKELRVANLCLTHSRKTEGRAIHAAMGSVAFVAQCRVAWAFTRCPTNKKRRLMTCIKNNLADDTTGLACTIESYAPDASPVLAWEAEPVRMSAEQAMDQLRKPRGRKPDDRNSAADWLSDQLANGERPAADILNDADAEGFKPWTVRRAFKQLECRRWKSGFDDGWIWALPEDDSEGDTEHQGPNNLQPSSPSQNTEENTPSKSTNKIALAKVTNCLHGSRATLAEFEAERLTLSNGHGEVPF